MNHGHARQVRDYFYYASKPACGKEIIEATGINKYTVYGVIRRLCASGFIKAVHSPDHLYKFYVLNIRTANPLDSWLPNPDILFLIMKSIGKGVRFSDLLALPYSKETITVYLRALFAERIIGCRNREYYLIEKNASKVQLGDLKQYPTLKELKERIKPTSTRPEDPVQEEPAEWDEGNFNKLAKKFL